MTQLLFQVDAFTAEPFAGNPAAVCLLEPGAEPDPAWMQQVAAEMNLSETAFLRPGPEPGAYGLRWFTPTVEVELCGHATLASAHVLWSEGRIGAGEPIRFASASGPLAARPGLKGTIWLDFPATPAEPVGPPSGLVEALGAGAPRWVGRGRFDYLVELEDEAAVRDLAPDLRRLGRLTPGSVGGDRDRGRDRPGRLRLRVPLLRPRGRDRRGPGHRVGPLHPRPVLGRAPGTR